jgi:hypothetical protein
MTDLGRGGDARHGDSSHDVTDATPAGNERTVGCTQQVEAGAEEVRDVTNREQLTQVLDDALVRFRGRDLVSSAEVVDVLLDLRLLLLEVETLEEMLDEPASATGRS